VFLGQGEDLLGVHVARDHQDGVVRRIPEPVPVTHVVQTELLQIARPADHRIAIGRGVVGGGAETLIGQGLRIVVGAGAPFFLDDFQLLEEFLLAELEVAHPLGFQLEGDLQPVAGEILIVGRVVAPGEGVLLTAVLGDDARELPRRQTLGALEHHVLQDVRDAGDAAVLIARSDAIPDLRGQDGGAMIGLDQDLESVVELALVDLGRG
jgi:hypothetical protein